ncbi:hypothetical protein I317_03709 [Kwoniella heveanensis CBS 569]|uniref:Uncharacterized protein n=1 Tax=Kwoniella heveanensis BCC8398 TaxID=1296120 RepID=A0A1B9GQG3_9TREE|nr:hypothetical protein I316_04969 [Kwoniella heveanensis BCC8398]OCF42464.1 hypothetical protein I317_03709 [Kwoniella heveanensis CBS 569]
MRVSATTPLISALLLASSALAQRYTTTLPWANGDTVVVSAGTNAAGVAVTTTLSTVTGAAGVTTALTTARTTTTAAADDDDDETTTTTRNTRATTTTQARGPNQLTTTSYDPMRTTTYWLDPGDGVYQAYTWTAPTTTLPQEPTALVPAGTIQDYQEYQSNVNSVVLQSAEAAVASSSNSGSGPSINRAMVGGWSAIALGAVGAGVGALLI